MEVEASASLFEAVYFLLFLVFFHELMTELFGLLLVHFLLLLIKVRRYVPLWKIVSALPVSLLNVCGLHVG